MRGVEAQGKGTAVEGGAGGKHESTARRHFYTLRTQSAGKWSTASIPDVPRGVKVPRRAGARVVVGDSTKVRGR